MLRLALVGIDSLFSGSGGEMVLAHWFEDPMGHRIQHLADGSVVPIEIAGRVEQLLVEVLGNPPSHQAMVSIIKHTLSLNFCPRTGPRNMKTSATSIITQAVV